MLNPDVSIALCLWFQKAVYVDQPFILCVCLHKRLKEVRAREFAFTVSGGEMYYDCWQFENWRLFLAARILMYFTTEIYPDPVGLKWLMWQYSEVQWQIHLWSCAMTGAGLFWTCVNVFLVSISDAVSVVKRFIATVANGDSRVGCGLKQRFT